MNAGSRRYRPDPCTEKDISLRQDVSGNASARPKAVEYMKGSLADFLKAKKSKPGPYDWADDGCSNVPDSPGGYQFKNACARHDFGYRNFGKGLILGRNDDTREWVDGRFRTDMLDICRTKYSNASKCRGYAADYYTGVRTLGGKAFYGR